MNNYTETKNYGNRSEMLRIAFRTLKQVFPLESSNTERISIEDRLKRIEKRLEEIKIETKIMDKEDRVISNQELALNIRESEIHERFDKLSPNDIPHYEEIVDSIMKLISNFKNTSEGGIKDFVLMEHLRPKYTDSLVWLVLYKLRKLGKLMLEKGVWKIAKKD